MVIAMSGFGMGFRSLEHRLVSHSGTRTAEDGAGEARKGRKSKERRFVLKAEAEETDAGEN